jgi:hypothetical protein
LTSLPELPNSLNFLDCTNNNLTSLSKLPDSLMTLYCWDNKWLEPLNFNIVEKFKLSPYNNEQIELFNSYEFQLDNLNEFNFKDYTVGYLEIHKKILNHPDFEWIFNSNEFGLL